MNVFIYFGWYLLFGMILAWWSYNSYGYKTAAQYTLGSKIKLVVAYAVFWPIALIFEIRRLFRKWKSNRP
jgi:hypothetical protein